VSTRSLAEKFAALSFRAKLRGAMTLVVFVATALVLFVVQRRAESEVQANLQREFQGEFNASLGVQKTRLAAISARCRSLARSVRIRAALEENDIPDLYANAAIELRDLLADKSDPSTDTRQPHARFFRFLDAQGAVMPMPGTPEAQPWEAQLVAPLNSNQQQVGYAEVPRENGGSHFCEIVMTPIVATDTGEVIGAIVLGFGLGEADVRTTPSQSGIWFRGQAHLPALRASAAPALNAAMAHVTQSPGAKTGTDVELDGQPNLLFAQVLNPGSHYPPAYQVGLYPLADALAQQQDVRWQILGVGAAVMLCGLIASHFVSAGLSAPVEKLAVVSAENRVQRERAEAALEETNEELRARNLELQTALTELKAAQQHVIQQERLRALGEMASGIAHDFNNALVPILGFCELLLLSPKVLGDKEKAARYLETIQTAAKDAASVVARLREFYRPDKSDRDFAPVNLKRLAEQAITLTKPRWKDQAQAAGATIQIALELESVPAVSGEESGLREVLTNLIFNAVDAMPKGGTITLRTRSTPNSAVLEVSDTGTGMTEDVRRRCLEPFFSTKGERGTGLGLSMVFGIVQRHSGSLDLRSEFGKGTTFIITLPLQEAAAETGTAAANHAPIRPLRLLVVEDEAPIRDTLSAILTADGHDVTMASDGVAGLREFNDGVFDLVLSDKAMPGMSGDQMASAIKRVSPKTPIILLTGFGLFHDKSEFPGVDVLASKPIRIPMLRDAIATAMQAAA
jgi:signal transduction histidine kinase